MSKAKWYVWVLIAAAIVIIVLVVRSNKNKSQGSLALAAKQSISNGLKRALSQQQGQADLDLLNKTKICIDNIPDSDISAYYTGVSDKEYAKRLLAKCGITSSQVDRILVLIQ